MNSRGERDESADSAKGSPRSLSERLAHVRIVKSLCNIKVKSKGLKTNDITRRQNWHHHPNLSTKDSYFLTKGGSDGSEESSEEGFQKGCQEG